MAPVHVIHFAPCSMDGLLKWCNKHTRGHDHIRPVEDYAESWADGLGFCALMYSYESHS